MKKGMATHSSILAWRIPWTEEPGGLQSMVWQESDMTQRLKRERERAREGDGECVCVGGMCWRGGIKDSLLED